MSDRVVFLGVSSYDFVPEGQLQRIAGHKASLVFRTFYNDSYHQGFKPTSVPCSDSAYEQFLILLKAHEKKPLIVDIDYSVQTTSSGVKLKVENVYEETVTPILL